jgi:CubicO group peptidase (beta-lactamase class C family)
MSNMSADRSQAMIERTKQLNLLMDQLKEQATFNGGILVAEKGEILLNEVIGIAEYTSEKNRPLTINSMYEIASVSKPVTALGIISLQQMGKLQWDDLISKWLPELPYPGITIRHLLCHTSGLPDYMELFAKEWDHNEIATNEDVLKMLIKFRPDPLFTPNEEWTYSNTGYIILALLIDRISGLSYGEFLAQHFFSPLGMTRTEVYNRRASKSPVPEDFAFGYVYREDVGHYVLPDEITELDYVYYLDGLQGDGMVNSTLEDLLKLDRALYQDDFIDSKRRDLMFAPVKLNHNEYFDYGFGWLIENHEQLGKIVYHSGGWPGYSAMFKRYIDQDFTLIMLQNGEREYRYTHEVIHSIEQILTGLPFEAPAPIKERIFIPLLVENYEFQLGTYQFNDEGKTLNAIIYVEQNQLYMKLSNEMVFSLLPLSPTRYFELQTATELEFGELHSGQTTQLIWYEGETQNIAKRII